MLQKTCKAWNFKVYRDRYIKTEIRTCSGKVYVIKLYYDRIDISEGIDLPKSNNSKECMICHYFFFNHGFKFQDSAMVAMI